MAHRLPVADITAADTLTPREIEAEFSNYAEEINGQVDRDNIGGALITHTQLATGALQLLHYDGQTLTQDIVAVFAQDPGWVEIGGIELNITTTEAALVIDAGVNYACTANGTAGSRIALGVKVDEQIFSTDWESVTDEQPAGNADIVIVVQVAPGLHRIVPVVRVLPREVGTMAAGITVRLYEGQLMALERRR